MQESKDVLLQRTQEERRQREVCGINNSFSLICPCCKQKDLELIFFVVSVLVSCKTVHE